MKNKKVIIKKLVKENIRQISSYKETSNVETGKTYGINCMTPVQTDCSMCVIYKVNYLYGYKLKCHSAFDKILKVFDKLTEEDKLEILVGEIGK